MVNLVLPNQTVRIGPGIFLTRGIDIFGSGWSVQSGTRIVGAGPAATQIKLTDNLNLNRFVIGMPDATTELDGFEISDLTVDCGFTSGTATVSRGIFVYGKNIYLHHLRVVNFGSDLAALIPVIQASRRGSENSVVEQCEIIAPDNLKADATFACIFFDGHWQEPHRFSVARECLCRGPAAGIPPNVYGILPGPAQGFLAEGNQGVNLTAGIYDPPGTESAHDLIIRNNHFRNVGFGIYYKDRGWPVNRILIHDNVIDVGSAFTGPAGIRLLSATGSQFSALIIRKNIIRNAVWDVSQDITGVHVSGGIDLNIENNLINNTSTGTGGTGVIPAAFTAMRIFNNRNTTGQLVYPDTP